MINKQLIVIDNAFWVKIASYRVKTPVVDYAFVFASRGFEPGEEL